MLFHNGLTCLIQKATALKSPAERTVLGWRSALEEFLAHAAVTYPTSAKRQHAIAYRSWLLERLSPSTVKTRLAYRCGLWSVLHKKSQKKYNFIRWYYVHEKTQRSLRFGCSSALTTTKSAKHKYTYCTLLPPVLFYSAHWSNSSMFLLNKSIGLQSVNVYYQWIFYCLSLIS